MVKNKRRSGFVIFMIILFSIILSSIIFSVNMLSISHSTNVMRDLQKNKTYYIAYSGVQMVYSALNNKPTGSNSLMELLGTSGYDKGRNSNNVIMEKNNLEIKQNSVSMGYADIIVWIGKQNAGQYYYKIQSTGKLNTSDDENNPSDTRVITMFVTKDSPNNPILYDGIKESI